VTSLLAREPKRGRPTVGRGAPRVDPRLPPSRLPILGNMADGDGDVVLAEQVELSQEYARAYEAAEMVRLQQQQQRQEQSDAEEGRRREANAVADISVRYGLGDVIGEGSFGQVRRATDVQTGIEVAIKIMPKEKLKDTTLLDREIAAGNKLQHAHIVSFLAYLEDPQSSFLVFGLVPGMDLLECISAGVTFSQANARLISQQATSALAFCHENCVAHRDIKLENVMIDTVNGVNTTLIDFGLCSVFESLDERWVGDHCGSADYCGPEILLRHDSYDVFASDVWALGVVMFILIFGTLPFNREERNISIIFKQLFPPAVFPSEAETAQVPAEARDVLVNMLNLDPATRPTAAELLQHPYMSG
jgi:serine/threonine protein kinase